MNPIDRPEAQVKAALITLHGAIKAANPPSLVVAMKALDDLLAAHQPELDPRLAHFLAGRSYAKAFAYVGITDGSMAPGSCAPRTTSSS